MGRVGERAVALFLDGPAGMALPFDVVAGGVDAEGSAGGILSGLARRESGLHILWRGLVCLDSAGCACVGGRAESLLVYATRSVDAAATLSAPFPPSQHAYTQHSSSQQPRSRPYPLCQATPPARCALQ